MPQGGTGEDCDPSRRQSADGGYRRAMRRYPEQSIAEQLGARLTSAALEARVEGEGVHWRVRVGTREARSATVDCFHYAANVHALMLRANPINAPTPAAPPCVPYEGAEYAIRLSEAGRDIATGRTRNGDDVAPCLRGWLDGESLDALVIHSPFVAFELRTLRAIAATLDPAYTSLDASLSSPSLVARVADRSCTLKLWQRFVVCDFCSDRAELARGTDLRDVRAAVRAWLVERVDVLTLAARVEVSLSPHAEWFERDAARWNWLRMRDRIREPTDVLAPLRALIERLEESAIATRFFTYSSLDRLCFSASSHYPWVSPGLPVVAPSKRSSCVVVDGVVLSIDEALAVIERRLAACPVSPFVGTADDLANPRR